MDRRMACAGLMMAVLALVAANSMAQITVSFPDLVGLYDTGVFLPNDGPYRRTLTFELPSSIQTIDGMRLVLSGQAQAGLMTRTLIEGLTDSMTFIPGMSLYLWRTTIPHAYFHATVQAPAGQFSEASAAFVPTGSAGNVYPGALIGAEIQGELSTDFVIGGWWNLAADSVVDLTAVKIEITGTVPDETTSWGAVQALYR